MWPICTKSIVLQAFSSGSASAASAEQNKQSQWQRKYAPLAVCRPWLYVHRHRRRWIETVNRPCLDVDERITFYLDKCHTDTQQLQQSRCNATLWPITSDLQWWKKRFSTLPRKKWEKVNINNSDFIDTIYLSCHFEWQCMRKGSAERKGSNARALWITSSTTLTTNKQQQ